MWLVRNGVQWNLAFALSEQADNDPDNVELGHALAIIFGQFEGGEFDWDQWKWKDPPKDPRHG